MPARRTSRPRPTRKIDADQAELPLAAVKGQIVAVRLSGYSPACLRASGCSSLAP